jgi:endonuclease/exonuclease/phosphatase family metal-dependent hydrolase
MSLLTVATLNIWHDRGPWPLRRGLILEELDRLEPDLVGLQEVLCPAGGVPQADELAAPLGYEGVYAAASRRPDGALLGNALLSRLSVRRQAMVPLPPDGVEPRSLLCALVDVPEGALPVFVTHLAWEHRLGAVRARQVRAVLAAVEQFAASEPAVLPAVLMGDFNTGPGAEELRPLDAGWRDAWSVAGDGPGVTFDPENDYVREWEEPPRRLDYVFVAADPRMRVREVATAFASPTVIDGQRVWPSDHYGIVCRLDLVT